MEIHIPADFTLGELQAFIEGERTETVEGYYTAREWADHFGIHIKKMRVLLKEAKAKGLLDMRRTERVALDDKVHRAPVYALRKAPDEESK